MVAEQKVASSTMARSSPGPRAPRRARSLRDELRQADEVFEDAPSEATCENVAAWIFLKEIRLDVRQYEGFMSAEDQVPGGVLYFTGARLSLTGATHADGTAELASVINISGDQLQLLSRTNLVFDLVNGAPNSVSGVLRSRITSRVPDGAIDCEIDFELAGTANVEEEP